MEVSVYHGPSRKNMNYKLTTKAQINRKGKDGKNRSFLLVFLNGSLILKQKIPFDPEYNRGYQHNTEIKDIYLLNGRIYQTRIKEQKQRLVSYPISKTKLEIFNIPKNMKITEEQYERV